MIIERLNPKQQRLLAIGLMVLLLAAVYLIVVQPIVSMHQDYDGRIGELHDRLAGYKKIAGSRGALQKEFDRIKKQVTATQAGYLKSKTQALAGAELQDRVKRVIESGGGRLTSIQILQPEDESKHKDTPPRVTIRVQMTGSIETVQKVLHKLESGQPRLFIDNAYVRTRSAYIAGTNKPQNDQLDIRFNLYGFLQTAARS